MKFGVVTFPGSNCDYDSYAAVRHVLGEDVDFLWHKSEDLLNSDVVILPGGFSYGDYLRAGAIAKFSPIMDKVIKFAENGGFPGIDRMRSIAGCPDAQQSFTIQLQAGLSSGGK